MACRSSNRAGWCTGPAILDTLIMGRLSSPEDIQKLVLSTGWGKVVQRFLIRKKRYVDRGIEQVASHDHQGNGEHETADESAKTGWGARVHECSGRERIDYAAGRRATTGRCRRPPAKLTTSPTDCGPSRATGACGEAQREFAGQRARSSIRGRWQAGTRCSYTSSGVRPPRLRCGRWPLYQRTKSPSSLRIRSRRKGTRICRVPSVFIVRKNRSMSAMLPCFPTAP